MNVKRYLLTALIGGCLLSCSSVDEPISEVPEPDRGEGTLAVTLHNPHSQSATTKSWDGDESTAYDDYVSNLFIAVFNVDAYPSLEEGDLVLLKPIDTKKRLSSWNGYQEVGNITLKVGKVKVLVIANMDADDFKGYTTLSDFLNHPVDLSKEINGYLTMSSDVKSVTLVKDQETPLQVDLYRNVARVELRVYGFNLSKQTDTPVCPIDEKPYKNAKISVKSIFVANVKNKSLLAATGTWPASSVEATNNYTLWCGAEKNSNNTIPSFTKGPSYLNYNRFLYECSTIPSKGDLLPNYEIDLSGKSKGHAFKSSVERESTILNDVADVTYYLGRFFYVYENSNEETPTLFIMKADFSYDDEYDNRVSLTDRYYTVTINKELMKDDYIDFPHQYIKRNMRYSLIIVIAGPGSTDPYTPQASAYVTAFVKVKNWDVVEMHEEVD